MVSLGSARSKVAILAGSLAALVLGAPAQAAVPATVNLEGVVTSAGGGAAADGTYGAAFALYSQATGGTAVWSEANVQITVKSGAFSYVLGSKTPLAPATLATAGDLYLGMAVGTDPELPRMPLRSVAYALVADTALKATGLECSGCIKAAALDSAVLQPYAKSSDLGVYAKAADLGAYAKSTDLSAYAKSTDLAAYAKAADLVGLASKTDLADYAKAASLATVAGTGKYTDLVGLPALAKLGTSCGTGLVVKGLKADGSLDCASPFDAAAADTLAKLSQGLLTNNFTEVVPSAAPFDVKDNDPTGSSNGLINVPDLGLATSLTITVNLTSKDASGLIVRLYDPANTEYVLYDKSATGTTLKLVSPSPNKPVTGDLTTWIGKNPKGNWQLAVADTKANGGGIDGQVTNWSISMGVWSDKKVAVNGNLVLTANTQVCNTWQKGAMRWNAGVGRPEFCDGTVWNVFAPAPLGSPTRPAASCKAILDGGDSRGDGKYWVQPDAAAPSFETYCDMTTDGGGWTMVMSLVQGEYKLGGDDWNQKWQQSGYNRWADKSTFGDLDNASRYSIGDYKNAAYASLKGSDMLFYHVPDGTGIDQWRASSVYTYHTNTGFLTSKGPTVQGIFATSCPLNNGGGNHQCLVVPIVYDVGNATNYGNEQCPNNRGESERGYVTFGAWNGESYAFAFCPVKQNGANCEHSCVGGNGTTGGNGAGGWGNMREWYYDGNWCMSTKMRTAALMMLVR